MKLIDVMKYLPVRCLLVRCTQTSTQTGRKPLLVRHLPHYQLSINNYLIPTIVVLNFNIRISKHTAIPSPKPLYIFRVTKNKTNPTFFFKKTPNNITKNTI